MPGRRAAIRVGSLCQVNSFSIDQNDLNLPPGQLGRHGWLCSQAYSSNGWLRSQHCSTITRFRIESSWLLARPRLASMGCDTKGRLQTQKQPCCNIVTLLTVHSKLHSRIGSEHTARQCRVPCDLRARVTSLIYAVSSIGTVFSMAVTPALASVVGWQVCYRSHASDDA